MTTDAQRTYMAECTRAVGAYEAIMAPARVAWARAERQAAALGKDGRMTPREVAVWLEANAAAAAAAQAIREPAEAAIDAALAAAKETTDA
jgi:hypothetical protein